MGKPDQIVAFLGSLTGTMPVITTAGPAVGKRDDPAPVAGNHP